MSAEAVRPSHYRMTRYEAHNTWMLSENCSDWESHYEQLTSVPFRSQVLDARLGPMQVFCEEVNSPFRFRGRAWQGSRVFSVFLAGTGDLYSNNRPLPANALVSHRWDTVERLSCKGRYAVASIVLDEDFLRRYADRVAGERFVPDRHHALILSSDSAVVSNFQRNILDVLRDLAAAPDVLANECVRRTLQDSVLSTLMEALEASSGSADPLPPPTTRAYVVDKAIRFMESRLAASIVIAEVCEEVRVSPRTLRYSFEEVLGVSPTRYLLVRRLNQVRQELSICESPTLIEEIALRSGFWHMGRFAQFYRQTFGERPSDTRRRVDAMSS